MNAEFFALAIFAALNPKLLAVGLLLVAVGGLLATGRLHGRRRTPVPAGDVPPESRRKRTPGRRGYCGSPGSGWPC